MFARVENMLLCVTWSDTGYYNPTLSRAILNAAKACMRKSKPGRSS